MQKQVIFLILLMAISNYLMRALPVRLLTKRSLSPFFAAWLKYVPVPVLAAMLSSDLLFRNGSFVTVQTALPLAVAMPTFAVACLTKNLYVTVLAGIALIALARALGLGL